MEPTAMSTYTKFPESSHVTFDGVSDGQLAVAAAALEKIADRLTEQEQHGAAELLRRLGCAILEQTMASMEDANRGK